MTTNIHKHLAWPALGCLALAGISCIFAKEGVWYYVKAVAVPLVLLANFFPLYFSVLLSRMKERDKQLWLGIYFITAVVIGVIAFFRTDPVMTNPIFGNVHLYDALWALLMLLYVQPSFSLQDPDNITNHLAVFAFILSMLAMIGYIVWLFSGIGFLFWCLPAFFVCMAVGFFDMARGNP